MRQKDNSNGKEKNKQTEPKGPGFFKSVADFFTDRRTHGVVGLALILFAGYILVASLSFFVKGRADESVINNRTIEQISTSPETVENVGGASGAVLSQVILTNNLGLGAIVMIIYMVLIGLALLRVRKVAFWSLTFKSLLIAITISVVAGLLTYSLDTPFLFGGQHGRWINTLLIERAGVFGAMCVSIFLVGCVTFIYLNELAAMYMAYRHHVAERKEKERIAREERERRERKVRENVTNEVLEDSQEQPEAEPESTVIAETDKVVGFKDEDNGEVDPYLRHEVVENEPEIVGIEEAPTDDGIPMTVTGQDLPDNLTTDENGVVFEDKTGTVEIADTILSEPYDPTAELSHFKLPPIDLLKEYEDTGTNIDIEEQEANKKDIIQALKSYGVEISRVEATVGATITLFEIVPVEGTRIQTIKRLGEDLMMSLEAKGIRIIAPIPGKRTIGIEVPNKDPKIVSIRSILSSKAFQESKAELPVALGTTISNTVFVTDLAKMPHLLVAGATGQGKSVGLNAIITSLLYKKHPATLKFVLVDPKMVEFSNYSIIERHYLAKLPDEEEAIITAPDKVINTLNSLCVEMDNRYNLLKEAGCRKLTEYNEKFINRRLNPEKGHRFLPYIVIIVDEFGDLIMTAGKEVETPIARIAQKARAVGMHMIIATQRPSTNIVTGIIKANFPGRMAFKVAQGIDSKTILDRPGANQLIGRGDMLISQNGTIERVQCAFIDTPEVDAICQWIAGQQGYPYPYELPEYIPESDGNTGNANAVTNKDELFEEVARTIVLAGTASTSSLQRRYSIGFNRAGKIMDQMEAAGIVGPSIGGKPRAVLMDPAALENLLASMN